MTQYTQQDYDALWGSNKCHTGNTVIFENWNGKKMYIGGWDNGAEFDKNTFVIDLTGLEHKYWDVAFAYTTNASEFLPFVNTSYGGWLSLPFPDYGVPTIKTIEQWTGIARTICDKMDKGLDVLVACHGGHGRSGLFCSIVGYILNIKKDSSWASPVEKVRTIHCQNAVETFAQEKFVYSILNLDIEVKHVYADVKSASSKKYSGELCPICGNVSYQLGQYGMCANCSIKYRDLAPIREDLTLDDIDHLQVQHTCTHGKQCVGIWTAAKCGHVTHDMIVYDGLCEVCWNKAQDEKEYAEKALAGATQLPDTPKENCAICGHSTHFANIYGVCLTCGDDLVESGQVEEIHNSITDPFRWIEHKCTTNNPFCNGIVKADVCKHILHDRDVIDGLCPSCYNDKHPQEVQK